DVAGPVFHWATVDFHGSAAIVAHQAMVVGIHGAAPVEGFPGLVVESGERPHRGHLLQCAVDRGESSLLAGRDAAGVADLGAGELLNPFEHGDDRRALPGVALTDVDSAGGVLADHESKPSPAGAGFQ